MNGTVAMLDLTNKMYRNTVNGVMKKKWKEMEEWRKNEKKWRNEEKKKRLE